MQAKKFPDQSFDAVSFYCGANFFAGRNTQPPMPQVMWKDKENKMCCKITTAPGITCKIQGPFGDLKFFGKS
jgi:hypothetical protein